ncbi:MAG: hypothetical protein AAF699_15415 [Pseudomonadota bacterium]
MRLGPKTFLASSVVTLLVLLLGYVFWVDRLVIPEPGIPGAYGQLLLESGAELQGKVVVESGSNSQYGIDPLVLSDYFRAPVLIVAVNANFPLRLKIQNLRHYLLPGDVLILPLEWNMYIDDHVLTDDFIDVITADQLNASYYYHNLPSLQRIRFILQQLPLQAVAGTTFKSKAEEVLTRDVLTRLGRYRDYTRHANAAAFGAAPSRKAPAAGAPQGCNGYILGHQIFRTGFVISDEFRAALKSLRVLRERGVRVVFTWPSVADSEGSRCYGNGSLGKEISQYADDIRAIVKEAGYPMIGTVNDARFPARCFADTHYHLTGDCAIERTEQLVAELAAAGIEPVNSEASLNDLRVATERLVESDMERTIAQLESELRPLETAQLTRFDQPDVVLSGWYQPSATGVWSKGNTSTIVFRLPADTPIQNGVTLTLTGRYFNGSEATVVTLNALTQGAHDLSNAEFHVPSNAIADGIVRLVIEHQEPVSPLQLGISQDPREIKYQLTAIEVVPSSG